LGGLCAQAHRPGDAAGGETVRASQWIASGNWEGFVAASHACPVVRTTWRCLGMAVR